MTDDRWPMADAPGELQVSRRVQFSETDAAGIVHFSCFFRYLEDAEHELWRRTGLSIHPENSSIGWPRVAASCEYFRPLKFEQEFEVTIRVADLTKRTITYEGTITRDGERVAKGSWKIACVVRLPDGSMKSAEIPPNVAERLKPSTHRASDIGRRTSDTA